MIERLAIDVEQRADPKIAGAIPHHVGEARIGHRVDDLAAVDVGADDTERRHDGKIVATVPGTLKTNDPQVTEDDIVIDTTSANAKTLKEIDFSHNKESLVFVQSGM